MESLLVSIRCITPVFLCLCLGVWVRWRNIIPEELFGHLSTLCFHSLIPFQLFFNLYNARLDSGFPFGLIFFLEGGLLLWFGVSYILFTIAEPDPGTRGAFIQGAFRSNIAVVGVSLAQTMMGPAGVAAVTAAIAVLVPSYNVLAVFALESCRGGHIQPKETLRMIVKNPLIIACVLGTAFLLLGIRLPQPVEQTIQNIGNAGSMVTLLALGASLKLDGARKNRRKLVLGNLYRLVVTPFFMLSFAALIGLRRDELGTVLICTATPMATAAHPMAIACSSDHELTGQLVVSTSLLCCLTMFLWIFVFNTLGFL